MHEKFNQFYIEIIYFQCIENNSEYLARQIQEYIVFNFLFSILFFLKFIILIFDFQYLILILQEIQKGKETIRKLEI